jgi:hypothetical protein
MDEPNYQITDSSGTVVGEIGVDANGDPVVSKPGGGEVIVTDDGVRISGDAEVDGLFSTVEVPLDREFHSGVESEVDLTGGRLRLRNPHPLECLLHRQIVSDVDTLAGKLAAIPTDTPVIAFRTVMVIGDDDHLVAPVDPVFREVCEFSSTQSEATEHLDDEHWVGVVIVIRLSKFASTLEEQLELAIVECVLFTVTDVRPRPAGGVDRVLRLRLRPGAHNTLRRRRLLAMLLNVHVTEWIMAFELRKPGVGAHTPAPSLSFASGAAWLSASLFVAC